MNAGRVRLLVDGQAVARERLTERVSAAVVAAFTGFDGWYSDAQVTQVAAEVAARVNAGTRGIAALTDGYLARVASEMLGATVAPAGLVISGSVRAGVPSTQAVYERVAKEFRYQATRGFAAGLAAGAVVAGARAKALDRADRMVRTDMGLAHQQQSRRFMTARNVDGYRRVIRPEKSENGTCGLCAAASGRVYKRGDLLPIHTLCGCETLPIINGMDPGRDLNRAELDSLYEAAGSTGPGLKRIQVRVTEHGELGPVLTDASHHVRTSADVTRDLAA